MNWKLNIAITRISNPYGHPNILVEFIAGQLKNRVSFCKAMKKAIELTEQVGTKGIQVQIAEHIDRKEIAHVKWIKEGRVPLQTIRAKIDYCSYTVRTIYGVLGIKFWIFVNGENEPLLDLSLDLSSIEIEQKMKKNFFFFFFVKSKQNEQLYKVEEKFD